MAEAAVKQQNRDVVSKEGKYLTFSLGAEQYGLEILKVREIIGYIEVTAVPQTPHHVKGVINLRGQVIPVIDLRAKFGMETADVTEQSCIIVVESPGGAKVQYGDCRGSRPGGPRHPGGSIEDAPRSGRR